MKNILYIVWNEINNLGIPIIDEQHRGVISTINSLHFFISSGNGHEIVKPTVIMLEQYVNVHFKTEEALLKRANYPALKEHIALHKEFAEKIKKFSTDPNRNMDSELVLKFLKEWWLGHITKEDRKYIPFLKQ